MPIWNCEAKGGISVERLTIPDVMICENTTRRTIIDASEVKKHAMEIYWRLKKIEDILGDDYDLDRLRELVEADRDGRCVVLPKDGMIYYIEETGGEKWIANKPIQQITVKCGWGIASLEFSLFDTGKYFTREAAEAALKGEQDGNMV